MSPDTHVVTGALGYSGRVITEQLLAQGHRVRTLTNSPDRPNPFSGRLEIHPLTFDDPDRLVEAMRGADTLINTYWVRFNHRLFNHEQAVRNTRTLFDAAKRAGVHRIVHVSILNPQGAPELSYYKGKAMLEAELRELGIPYSIVRPGVLFGRGDILVNNIAWGLRHVPVFGVFGDGKYKLRPMHVDDFARLIVSESVSDASQHVVDAIGPERFTYSDLVRTIANALNVKPRIVRVPTLLGLCVTHVLGRFVKDVILTREEVRALTMNLLDSEQESTASIKLTEWVREHANELGVRYASELRRRTDRAAQCASDV